MRARHEQMDVEYNHKGEPVSATLMLTIQEETISFPTTTGETLLFLSKTFERTYEGTTFEFKEVEFRTWTNREAKPPESYVIAKYEGTLKK